MTKYGIFNQPAVTESGKVKNEASTAPKMGCGDYYGTGVRNPVGKMRGDSVGIRPVSHKSLKVPPKSVV